LLFECIQLSFCLFQSFSQTFTYKNEFIKEVNLTLTSLSSLTSLLSSFFFLSLSLRSVSLGKRAVRYERVERTSWDYWIGLDWIGFGFGLVWFGLDWITYIHTCIHTCIHTYKTNLRVVWAELKFLTRILISLSPESTNTRGVSVNVEIQEFPHYFSHFSRISTLLLAFYKNLYIIARILQEFLRYFSSHSLAQSLAQVILYRNLHRFQSEKHTHTHEHTHNYQKGGLS